MKDMNTGKKSFFIIWSGQLVSIIGSGLTGFALGVWVYQKTGMATYYAMIVLFTTLPSILARPFGGVLADRFSRRTLIIISDIGSSLGIFFIAMMIWTNHLQIWHIYAGMCFSSIFTGIGGPTYQSAITQLIPKNFYAQASGMSQASASANYLISPILATVLMPFIGINGILILDFFSFIYAIISTFLIKIPHVADQKEDENGIKIFVKYTLDAMKYLKERRGLTIQITIIVIINFLMGFLVSLIGPMILSFSTAKMLGLGESISAVGMMISSIAVIFIPEPKRLIKCMMRFLFFLGISYSLIGFKASFITIVVPCFVFFMSLPFVNTYGDIVLRRSVDNKIQGRVYAVIGMLVQAGVVLAYIIAGPLSDCVFEPLMSKGGLLEGSVGKLIGVGPGRGIGLIFVIMGIGISLVALIASRLKALKQLENELEQNVKEAINMGSTTDMAAE